MPSTILSRHAFDLVGCILYVSEKNISFKEVPLPGDSLRSLVLGGASQILQLTSCSVSVSKGLPRLEGGMNFGHLAAALERLRIHGEVLFARGNATAHLTLARDVPRVGRPADSMQ